MYALQITLSIDKVARINCGDGMSRPCNSHSTPTSLCPMHCRPTLQWAAFEDEHGIYLCTEFAAKGDVFADVEKRGGSMSESEAVRQVIAPFLSALMYLHDRKIMHR